MPSWCEDCRMLTSNDCGKHGQPVQNPDPFLMNWEGRLQALEDRVTRLAMREHRHADEPDGYQAAYVEGYQAGFNAARTEMQTALIEMGNKPIPRTRIDGDGCA